MTDFEQALADYRDALEAAAVTAVTDDARWLYAVHRNVLMVIEHRYADSFEPAYCRALMEAEQALHQADGLRGEAVDRMRAAFERLMRAAES